MTFTIDKRGVETAASSAAPVLVGLTRIVIGFLFACHGVASLFGVWGRPAAVEIGAWPGFYAATIQLVCGVLVALGAGSRIAAVLGSGSMAYAYFSVHQSTGLLPIVNHGEPAAMFCWTLLLLAVVGPGALTLPGLVRGRRGSYAGSAARADSAEPALPRHTTV